MRKRLHTLWGVVAVAMSLSSCADDMYDNSPDEALKLSVETILINNSEQTLTIGVTARDEGWTMSGLEPWCSVTPASGEMGITQVSVAFTSNDPEQTPGAEDRRATFVFRSGGVEKSVSIEQLNIAEIPLPHENPDAAANRLIFEELEKWYYNDEPLDVRPDYNQYYDDFYFNYLSHLKLNEDFEGKMWATGNERFIYSRVERNPVGTAAAIGPQNPYRPLNYGMEFDMIDYNGTLAGRILYVEPGSPAARGGLRRGDWFWEVNGTRLGNWPNTSVPKFKFHYQRFIDTLVHPIATESPRLRMLTFRTQGQGSLLDEGRDVTLTPALWANDPILAPPDLIEERLLPALGGEMTYSAYLMYNNFDPYWRDKLIETFRTNFANRPEGEEIENFILDLRYNKHGSVEMAELMGNLLVGNVEGVAGLTFAKYTFNQSSGRSRTVQFETHPDGIAPSTVFILTSRHTAGAAELLINALRGIDQDLVKLVVVGEVTQGLAAGMVKRTVPDPIDGAWEYSAWMLAFRCHNANGDGDYTWGLVPNSEVSELQRGDNMKWSTTWEWKGPLGSTEDPLIKRAVDIIKGRQMMPAGIVGNATKSSRTGFPREFCFPTDMTMEMVGD